MCLIAILVILIQFYVYLWSICEWCVWYYHTAIPHTIPQIYSAKKFKCFFCLILLLLLLWSSPSFAKRFDFIRRYFGEKRFELCIVNLKNDSQLIRTLCIYIFMDVSIDTYLLVFLDTFGKFIFFTRNKSLYEKFELRESHLRSSHQICYHSDSEYWIHDGNFY